jgi:hypothetical protein
LALAISLCAFRLDALVGIQSGGAELNGRRFPA